MKDIFVALNIAGIRAMPGKGELKYEAVSKSMNRRAIDHNSRSLNLLSIQECIFGLRHIHVQGKMRFGVWTMHFFA